MGAQALGKYHQKLLQIFRFSMNFLMLEFPIAENNLYTYDLIFVVGL